MTRRNHTILVPLCTAVVLGAGVFVATASLFPATVAAAAKKPALRKVAIIPVSGMTCGGCAANITAVLDDIDGVEKSSVDLKKAQAVIRFDPKKVTVKRLVAAIESVGFDPGKPVVRNA